MDSRELARHNAHLALREACASGDIAQVRTLISQLGSEAGLVVNMAPNGSNTLLYTACELGRKDIVKALLDADADGRIHPVTRYSPLYIACFKGHKDVAELLLKRFPQLVQLCTVERWLPIHAACFNDHVQIMDLLLKFNYPQHLLSTYSAKVHCLDVPRVRAYHSSDTESSWLSIWAAIQADFELLSPHSNLSSRSLPNNCPDEDALFHRTLLAANCVLSGLFEELHMQLT
ncbi:hypothetical protein J6590_056309 [Homalodisca vitripennis]|nr:hypothetical protein J6590_056309 [Homalodisca vitripennis]